MKLADIVSAAGLAWYAQVALVLFVLAFLLVLWRVFKPSLKAKYDGQRVCRSTRALQPHARDKP